MALCDPWTDKGVDVLCRWQFKKRNPRHRRAVREAARCIDSLNIRPLPLNVEQTHRRDVRKHGALVRACGSSAVFV